MNFSPRIKLNDDPRSAMMKMAEGNPGAITVLIQLFTTAAKIDPDDIFGGLGPLFQLDMLGFYGSKIWMLFKDVCEQNVERVITVLRANQLGLLSEAELNSAIAGHIVLNHNDILRQVQEQLPNFNKQ